MYTSQVSPKYSQAMARAQPHCPAPVSVVSALMPSSLLKKAWASAVLSLCEPTGERLSFL